MKIPVEALVPGGIRPTDFVHHITNDGTCSRCRKPIAEAEVPLMLWPSDGDDMLIYCESCLGTNARSDDGETETA